MYDFFILVVAILIQNTAIYSSDDLPGDDFQARRPSKSSSSKRSSNEIFDEDDAKLAKPKRGIPGRDLPKIKSGFTPLEQTPREILDHKAELAKSKLSLNLRLSVPNELVLLSGFKPDEQDPLEMAGCYIRLGSNLKPLGIDSESGNLAATSFLSAGGLYATVAREANDVKVSADLLTSAAQCYYWSFCNETLPDRKKAFRKLAADYFDKAFRGAVLMPEGTDEDRTEKSTLLKKIATEKGKLESRA